MDNQLDYEINKELGECYLFMGDFDKAEEYYRKAASNNAQSAAPYMGLATVAVQRSELEKALVLYQKAAAVEETDKALCGIGLVYMEQGKHEDAFSHFARALDKSAANIVALNCLVREAYQLGCVEQVLPYLEAALACSEEAEAVRVTLAGCLIYLGRSDEARTWKPCWAPIRPITTPRNFSTPWPRKTRPGARPALRAASRYSPPHTIFRPPAGAWGRKISSSGEAAPTRVIHVGVLSWLCAPTFPSAGTLAS